MAADPRFVIPRPSERDPRPWWALELVKRLEAIEQQQRRQTAALAALAPFAAAVGWAAAKLMGVG